jgi:adenylate cyclase
MERRLAAILAADVVGYSRLVRADEEGTLIALKALHQDIIDPIIAAHRGRTVKLMGDGMLVEFASAVDAVRAAVQILRAVSEHNSDLPGDKRIEFRVGINLGDVVVDGEDIQGDGVNVAARLEGLASPGGVCISGKVYEEVRDRTGFGFEDLGERQLKNIDRAVRVWRWLSDAAATVGDGSPSEKTLAPEGKPSLAVLPFNNMSADPDQEYFSDGITEDIITELSRFHSLLVIARHSSFAFKGEAVDVTKVGRQLDVQYIVEGSVRRIGNRLRVTAQLIETSTGNHIWAERYDRELEDIFTIQDELVRAIVSTVGGRIEAVGKKLANRLNSSSVRAYDLCLRAQALQDRNTREAYQKAERCLRQAIDLDPHMAQAYHQLSLVKFWEWTVHWSEDPDNAIVEAFELAEKALALDDTDSMVHAHLCMLHVCRREFDEAGHRIDQALRLNPNDAKALGINGFYLIAVGKPDQAVQQFDALGRLNPVEPGWITRLRGLAYLNAGRYEDAISLLKSLETPINVTRAYLAASLAHTGHAEEARKMLEEFLRVAERNMIRFPGRRVDAWKRAWRLTQYKNQEDSDRFFEGLRKAGLED